jgi:D-alanyl-D-alanine carboxypeptidase (penicillin-binding protein 5/6)
VAARRGSASPRARAYDAEKLLGWGYANFEDVRLGGKNTTVASSVVWKGTQKTIKAGYADDRYETVAKGTGDKIKTEIVLQDKLTAPLVKGARIGMAKVSYNGKPLAEVSVVAMEDVPQAGLFARMLDTVRLWFA